MEKPKLNPAPVPDILSLFNEHRLENMNNFAVLNRLQRLFAAVDESQFLSLEQLFTERVLSAKWIEAPYANIFRDLRELQKILAEKKPVTTGYVVFHNVSRWLEGFHEQIETEVFFDKQKTKTFLTQFVTGLIELTFDSADLPFQQKLIGEVVGGISEAPGLMNKIIAVMLSGIQPDIWLEQLSPEDLSRLQKIFAKKLSGIALPGEKHHPFFQKWLLTVAQFLIRKLSRGELNLVTAQQLLTDHEISAEDLHLLSRKRLIEGFAVSQRIAPAWMKLQMKNQNNLPAEIILGQFITLYDSRYRKLWADAKEDSTVLIEPLVVCYRKLLKTMAEIEKKLLEHPDAIVRWSSWRTDHDSRQSDENADGDQRKTQNYTHTAYYLLHGYNDAAYMHQEDHESVLARMSTLSSFQEMGVANLRMLAQMVGNLSWAQRFQDQVNEEVEHSLYVLDSLTFKNEELNRNWQEWYQRFRPELADVIASEDELEAEKMNRLTAKTEESDKDTQTTQNAQSSTSRSSRKQTPHQNH